MKPCARSRLACQMPLGQLRRGVQALDVLLEQLAAIGAERRIERIAAPVRARGRRAGAIGACPSNARITSCWRPTMSSDGQLPQPRRGRLRGDNGSVASRTLGIQESEHGSPRIECRDAPLRCGTRRRRRSARRRSLAQRSSSMLHANPVVVVAHCCRNSYASVARAVGRVPCMRCVCAAFVALAACRAAQTRQSRKEIASWMPHRTIYRKSM